MERLQISNVRISNGITRKSFNVKFTSKMILRSCIWCYNCWCCHWKTKVSPYIILYVFEPHGCEIWTGHVWSSNHAYFCWSEQKVESNTITLMKYSYVAWERTKLSTQVLFWFWQMNSQFIFIHLHSSYRCTRQSDRNTNMFYWTTNQFYSRSPKMEHSNW